MNFCFKVFGTGGFPIEIESTIAGVRANFVMASGTVCATFFLSEIIMLAAEQAGLQKTVQTMAISAAGS